MVLSLTAEERTAGELTPERLREAVRAFQDTGIVIVEGAYEPEFIAEARAAYEVELAKYLEVRGGLDALEGKTFGKNHIGFFPPLFGAIGDARIAAPPIATQIMERVLGRNFHSSFYHTNTAMPGSGIQPVHRDQQHLFGSEFPVATPCTQLVLNVPLCDFTKVNGSTEYWPGSHLIPDHTPEDAKAYVERAANLPSIRLNMKVGAFALRDLRAWHRGMPNNANYARTMFALVYQREFIAAKPITIPRSTWETWPETARHIFRKNTVVDDEEHRAITWEELRG